MKACTCFLLFGAFAYTNPSPVSTPTKDKRGANRTLKSIPELNVKETSKNDFLATNKAVTEVNNLQQPYSTVDTFTDFIQELVIILNTYNDDLFEDFVHIVDKEIKKYPFRNQNEFKNLLAEESHMLMRKSVVAKRSVINQIVEMMKLLKIFDTNVREMLDYINSLYRDDAKEKFRKILTGLKGYANGYGKSGTKDDFIRLSRECVRATVIIHTNLNTKVKRKLKKHIDIFLKKMKEFPSSTSSTTNLVMFKPTIKLKSKTYTVKISENISTEDNTTKPSAKLNPTRTIAHIKEENKRIKIFTTKTIEAKQGDATITRDTSKRDETNSQQTNITHSGTNETVTEVMFYMTTEKPGIVYKSESKSHLVEKMFEMESTERQAAGRSTTTPRKRFSSKNELGRSKEICKKVIERPTLKQLTTKKEFRRSIGIRLPGEEPSIEIFDRDGRRVRNSHTRSNKYTTERSDLKDYLKRKRQLQTEVNRLKTINEINHNSKPYKDIESNGIDEHETKVKKPSHKLKESKNFKKSKHSYEHEEKVHREKNKVDDTVEESESSSDLERSGEIHKKKDTRSKSKDTTKESETSIEPNKHESRKSETSIEPNKHESKKLVLR